MNNINNSQDTNNKNILGNNTLNTNNLDEFVKVVDNQDPPPELDKEVPKKQELFGLDALLAKAAIDPQGFYHIDDNVKMDLNSPDLTVIQTQKDGSIKKMPLSEFLKVSMPDLPKSGESVIDYMRRGNAIKETKNTSNEKKTNISYKNASSVKVIKDKLGYKDFGNKNKSQDKNQKVNGKKVSLNQIKDKVRTKSKKLFSRYIFDPFVMRVLKANVKQGGVKEKSEISVYMTSNKKNAKIDNMERSNNNNNNLPITNDTEVTKFNTERTLKDNDAVIHSDKVVSEVNSKPDFNNLQEEVGEYSMQFGLEHKDLIGGTQQNASMYNNQINSNNLSSNNSLNSDISQVTHAGNSVNNVHDFSNRMFNDQNKQGTQSVNTNIVKNVSTGAVVQGGNNIVNNSTALSNGSGNITTSNDVNIDLQQLHKRIEKKNFAVDYDTEREEQDEPHLEGPTEILDPSLAKYKILIIEDNSDVRFQYEFILKREGFTVITAKNGEEGIVTAIKERPQLILLDILMPEVDGWEVLKALREYTATYKPKIMITSNLGAPEDIERAYKLGADLFVIKADTTLKELVNKVKKMLLHNNQQKVYMLPLNIQLPEVKDMLANTYPELQNGICPECGGPLGLKVIPIHKQDPNTNKTILEFTARLVCLRCGKEWI